MREMASGTQRRQVCRRGPSGGKQPPLKAFVSYLIVMTEGSMTQDGMMEHRKSFGKVNGSFKTELSCRDRDWK